jgi:serine/threonine protein kinase
VTFSGDQSLPQERTQVTGGAGSVAADFAPGQTIGNDYEVQAWIGAGGMGNVYRVRHKIMHSTYALKTLSIARITETAWRRFQAEAQAIGRMNHPNIVGIYNLGLHQDRLPFYVMDLLQGQTLQDLIQRNGPLDVNSALTMFLEIAAGMSYAHKKGIVHRDLKPPNIFLVENPGVGSGKIKIVDFGIAKLTGSNDETLQQLTGAGEICGSPLYMSPEQCEGGKIDARSDIYSLGCTLYESLTGSPPYRGRNAMDTMLMHQGAKVPSLAAAAPDRVFPPGLERAVATMLAKAPMDRHQSMDEVAEDLATILKEKDKPEKPFRLPAQAPGARRPVITRNQLREGAAEEAPKLNFRPWLIPAVALLLGVLTCIFFLPHKQLSRGAIDEAPFGSITTDASGKKQIVFNFPTQQSLGKIYIDGPGGEGTQFINCQGKQTVEAGHRLYFFPTAACVLHPQYFYNFRPSLISSVTFPALDKKGLTYLKADLQQLSQLQGLTRIDLINPDCSFDEVLPLLDQCHELEDLLISANNFPVRALVLNNTIKKIKSLTYSSLQVDVAPQLAFRAKWRATMHGRHRGRHHDDDDDEHEHEQRGQEDKPAAASGGLLAGGPAEHTAADQAQTNPGQSNNNGLLEPENTSTEHGTGGHERRWHHEMEMQGLEWDKAKTIKQSITPLLECLAKSNNLTSLEMPNIPLTAQDLKLIGEMTNLQAIDLSNSNIFSVNIDALTNLNKLTVFHVDDCLIDATAIPAFKKLAAHSLKFIAMKSLSMTPETVARYQKELPGVVITAQ